MCRYAPGLSYLSTTLAILKLVLAYPPTCNIIYGNPDPGDCNSILTNRFYRPTANGNLGIDINDNKHRAFSIAGIQQPASIYDSQV